MGSSEDPHRKIVKGRVFLAGLAYSNNPIYSNYFEGKEIFISIIIYISENI